MQHSRYVKTIMSSSICKPDEKVEGGARVSSPRPPPNLDNGRGLSEGACTCHVTTVCTALHCVMASELEAGFGLVTGNSALPLRDVSVEAEIRGYVLGLQSTLKYQNSSTTDPVEVQFRFPLEQSHAVVGLTAVIDGRKIVAEVKEKEEARSQYDDAIASGQTAAFAQEKSGDIFSVSLGNLPPQTEAEILLQLVGSFQ